MIFLFQTVGFSCQVEGHVVKHRIGLVGLLPLVSSLEAASDAASVSSSDLIGGRISMNSWPCTARCAP